MTQAIYTSSREDLLLIPTLPIKLTTPLVSKYWNSVEKGILFDDCWQWSGKKTEDGYPVLWSGDDQKQLRANRLSWVIHNGGIPPGLIVCHSCDNPECTNPAHLFLGDLLDNNADAIVKGRIYCHKHQIRRIPHDEARALLAAAMAEERSEKVKRALTGAKKGTKHASKLTREQVFEIFELLKSGGETRGWMAEIARRYGIHQNNITRMYSGKGWIKIGIESGFITAPGAAA